MRTLACFVIFFSLLLLASAVHAHARLKASVPAKNSTLQEAPASLALLFNSSARMTSLTIQAEDGAAEKLAVGSRKPTTEFIVPLPKLTPGSYTVTWRVIASDNHVTSGKIPFTLIPSADKSSENDD